MAKWRLSRIFGLTASTAIVLFYLYLLFWGHSESNRISAKLKAASKMAQILDLAENSI